jgi:hypothetical protein
MLIRLIFISSLLFPALAFAAFTVDVTLETPEKIKESGYAVIASGASAEIKLKNGIVFVSPEWLARSETTKIKFEIQSATHQNSVIGRGAIIVRPEETATTSMSDTKGKLHYSLTVSAKRFPIHAASNYDLINDGKVKAVNLDD